MGSGKFAHWCLDCRRVPSQSRPPPTVEPGDPLRCGSIAWVTDSYCQRVHTRPLSHGFQPCQLSQRESQGAGEARPAQRVRRCEPGGVAALGSPRWGSWRAISEPERAWAVAGLGKCGDCGWVPSQSRLAPCQLSQRESQGAGEARPAQRVRRCEPGGAAALGSPYGGAGEPTASLRGRGQWQIWENAEIVAVYPLSHGLRRASSPKGRAKGRLRRPVQRATQRESGGGAALAILIAFFPCTAKCPGRENNRFFQQIQKVAK